jgi:hypothetical protein
MVAGTVVVILAVVILSSQNNADPALSSDGEIRVVTLNPDSNKLEPNRVIPAGVSITDDRFVSEADRLLMIDQDSFKETFAADRLEQEKEKSVDGTDQG